MRKGIDKPVYVRGAVSGDDDIVDVYQHIEHNTIAVADEKRSIRKRIFES